MIDLVSDDLNEKTEHANALDLDRRPGLSRTDAKVILVHNRKVADKKARQMIVATAPVWGWHDPCKTHAGEDCLLLMPFANRWLVTLGAVGNWQRRNFQIGTQNSTNRSMMVKSVTLVLLPIVEE